MADENEGQQDHGDGGDPGDDVEQECIGVLSHEVFAVDEKKNKDDDDGEPDAVAQLRKDEDFPEWRVGQKNDAGAHDDEHGVKPVEGGGFAEFVINAGFKAHAFANDVGRRERELSLIHI